MKRRNNHKTSPKDLISANRLRQKYGLTDKMIARFFPEPDYIGDLGGKKKKRQRSYWNLKTVEKT